MIPTVSADQQLFDRLIIKKQAELRHALKHPQGISREFDEEHLRRQGEENDRLQREYEERQQRAFSAGGFEREVESIVSKIREAHEKLAQENLRPTHILTTPENLERIRAELTVREIDCEKGTITFSDASDLRNFDIDMNVRVIADPACPKDATFFLADPPKVKAASVSEMHKVLRELYPEDEIHEMAYGETWLFDDERRDRERYEGRLVNYGSLHCAEPGINFKLTLDDDPPEREYTIEDLEDDYEEDFCAERSDDYA